MAFLRGMFFDLEDDLEAEEAKKVKRRPGEDSPLEVDTRRLFFCCCLARHSLSSGDTEGFALAFFRIFRLLIEMVDFSESKVNCEAAREEREEEGVVMLDGEGAERRLVGAVAATRMESFILLLSIRGSLLEV